MLRIIEQGLGAEVKLSSVHSVNSSQPKHALLFLDTTSFLAPSVRDIDLACLGSIREYFITLTTLTLGEGKSGKHMKKSGNFGNKSNFEP